MGCQHNMQRPSLTFRGAGSKEIIELEADTMVQSVKPLLGMQAFPQTSVQIKGQDDLGNM